MKEFEFKQQLEAESRNIAKAVIDAYTRQVRRRFDTKQSPDGEPWKPWSRVTTQLYTRLKSQPGNSGRFKGLLDDTGKLKGSFNKVPVVNKAGDTFTGKFKVPSYFAVHEFGGDKASGFVPARNFLFSKSTKDVSQNDIDEITPKVVEVIKRGLIK